VGDGERGAALGHPLERGPDEQFRLAVDGAGRLVEHECVRVPEDRAGDREALALAARERSAALADGGIVAVLGAPDGPEGVGRLRHLHDGLLVGVAGAVDEVLPDGIVERKRFLVDVSDRPPDAVPREVSTG